MQCARIPGAAAGVLSIRHESDGDLAMAARWPERLGGVGELMQLSGRALAENRTMVASAARTAITGGKSQQISLLVAVPLGVDDAPSAVATLALSAADGGALLTPDTVAEQLRWGAGWLAALPWARRSREAASSGGHVTACLDIVATAGQHSRLSGVAMAVVNDLAIRLQCDRVSLGLIGRNGMIRVRAISHSATFKGEGRLVDALENAMEEAADQRTIVVCPEPAGRRRITIAHKALCETIRIPSAHVMSVALADSAGDSIGAITFERHRNEPFAEDIQHLAEAIAALLGPIIALQRRSNRMISGRLIDGTGELVTGVVGPRRPGLKLVVAGAIAALLGLMLGEGEHQVVARSVVEPQLQRAAVAPFDGFIRTAPVRAGDTVRRGDLVATLEDRDLVLDKLKWAAERDKLAQKQAEALAKHERTNVVVLGSQVRQAESQLALAEERLSRAQITAPFDGIVVSGDLSQLLGAPVERGKTLFEIAPLNAYRLIVNVDERDVRYVALDQHGMIALAGMPGDPLPFTVSNIVPVTVAEEGRNAFRIEARLTEPDPRVRPGMEGVARISIGQRPLVWIWTHSVIDAVRLAAWKHLP